MTTQILIVILSMVGLIPDNLPSAWKIAEVGRAQDVSAPGSDRESFERAGEDLADLRDWHFFPELWALAVEYGNRAKVRPVDSRWPNVPLSAAAEFDGVITIKGDLWKCHRGTKKEELHMFFVRLAENFSLSLEVRRVAPLDERSVLPVLYRGYFLGQPGN